MALAALIAAYHESAEVGALRATLPLAGRTLAERQVRLAAAAGANPVILLVERMPAELGAAIDRLRRERLPVAVARSAEEAAEMVDPFDRLLLIAGGAIADGSQLERLAANDGPAVLTVPDGGFDERFERIDAASRWAGFAVADGALLRETAAMLRDWDLQSTLLRRVLQSGARHVAAEGAVGILDRRSDLADLERRILQASEGERGGWASRLLAPVERGLTGLLMAGPVTAAMVGLVAALLTGLGAAAFARGFLWPGLLLILLATPLEGTAGRLARLRMQDGVGQSWWSSLLPAFSGAALLALAYQLAAPHGWGMVLLAVATLLFLLALALETGGRRLPGAALLAEPKGLAWLFLPFAVLGVWEAGLPLLFAYAAASFFWAQHQAHAAMAKRQD